MHQTIYISRNDLLLLHPFMPFLTEEIWQYIADRTPEQALIIAEYPKVTSFNEKLIADFDFTSEVIAGLRTIRAAKNIAMKDAIDLKVINNEKVSTYFDSVIMKLGNIVSLEYITEKIDGALTYRVKSNEYFIPVSGNIDIAAEITKLTVKMLYP